jgi:PAS domain S-box-containing protein
VEQPAREGEAALRLQIAELREQLRESRETLEAIRNGDVDAVVVAGADNVPRIYTLETADRSYRLLVEEMQEGALTLTGNGQILYCNPRFARLTKMSPEHIIGGSLKHFFSESDWAIIRGMIASESKGEFLVLASGGEAVATHLSFSALHGAEPDVGDLYCCVVTDLTEQRRSGDALRASHDALLAQVAERERTEELLRQSQKMEAVGQLTGGVAHDFNNLLMVILGGLNILGRDPTPERRNRLLEGMRQAAERGAALTRQLLAFARRKDLRPEPIDLHRHLDGLRELFDRSLRGDVNVKMLLDANVWPICVDAVEFEIALLNLCVNARDAMPHGGIINITAHNHANFQEQGLAGDFVILSVADSGEGMSAETLARCMEPFFTTKDVGKGSGLGLAQVYGFARGSGGTVLIDSELGRGTTVSLVLPRSHIAPSVNEIESKTEPTVVGLILAHVLLIEDDASVAELTTDMLHEIGYQVTHVTSAQAGLTELENDEKINLVVSDVMLPGGMDGVSFARQVRERWPHLPIVLASGFSEAVQPETETLPIQLLAKPYSLEDLASALRAAKRQSKIDG